MSDLAHELWAIAQGKPIEEAVALMDARLLKCWPQGREPAMKLRPINGNDIITMEHLRAIQLQAAQDALEFVANWIAEQRTVVPAHGFEFTNAIRAIKVEQP